MPPRVFYRLTALGRSLDGPLAAVRAWAEAHMAEIDRDNEIDRDSEIDRNNQRPG